MFSRNSPKPMRTSPRNRILSTSGSRALAVSGSSTLTTEPSLSLTTGPSIESTGITIALFPGLSIRTCVPTARKSSRITMVAGCTPTDARPVFLAWPYRSLKPPTADGWARTGLPTTESLRYL